MFWDGGSNVLVTKYLIIPTLKKIKKIKIKIKKKRKKIIPTLKEFEENMVFTANICS